MKHTVRSLVVLVSLWPIEAVCSLYHHPFDATHEAGISSSKDVGMSYGDSPEVILCLFRVHLFTHGSQRIHFVDRAGSSVDTSGAVDIKATFIPA